ncbi:hypothetical protein RP20_CCG000475 [Aedes albopictus]|nr:hypothetical protein RP20_CCG000475 [Aedes albopictus]
MQQAATSPKQVEFLSLDCAGAVSAGSAEKKRVHQLEVDRSRREEDFLLTCLQQQQHPQTSEKRLSTPISVSRLVSQRSSRLAVAFAR